MGRLALRVGRGGWIAGLVVLIVAATCIRLGFWQLDRLEQRRERNERLRQAMALSPVELTGERLAAIARDPEAFRYRVVRARGTFDPRGEVVWRGRSLEGRPGVNLLTPLRLAGSDTAVVVNRGWAASPDAATIDPGSLREPGPREVTGILLPLGDAPDAGQPREIGAGENALLTVRAPDLESLGARAGTPLLPVYLRQLPGDAGPAGLTRLPPPELGAGPHLGYAVQWFSFAAIALLGTLFLALRRTPRP